MRAGRPNGRKDGTESGLNEVSPLRAEAEAFLAQLAVQRRVSPHTLSAYRRDLELLIAHGAALMLGTWEALHPEQLRSFIAAQSLSPGFEPNGVVTASMDMFPSGYSGERLRD